MFHMLCSDDYLASHGFLVSALLQKFPANTSIAVVRDRIHRDIYFQILHIYIKA